MRAILILAKFRLSMLVTFSASIGYLLHGEKLDIAFLWLLLGTYLLAGGASGLNQYQERELDKLMSRTSKRPIPSGIISANLALFYSVLFIVFGFTVLLFNGFIPAILGLSNVVFYNLIYTPLKTRTPWSIVPGAVVGAIPPMMGWTSAGGELMHLNIIFIAVFMFLWQLPHFWLLLIVYGKEYRQAGFEMVAKNKDENYVKSLVFFWAAITSLFLFLFPLFQFNLGLASSSILIVFNIFFIFYFYRLLNKGESKKAIRAAFITINTFLMVVLITFAVAVNV